MDFLWPSVLTGLLALPVFVFLYVVAQRRRSRYAMRYSNLALLREVATAFPGWGRHVPPAIFLVAFAFLFVALARPQLVVPVPSAHSTVVLAIDVSRSMEATDIAPTRLAAAKAAALAFVERLPPNAQVGVVSFSGLAAVVVAPTEDRETVEQAINGLFSGTGTAIGDGLLAALGTPPRGAPPGFGPGPNAPVPQPPPFTSSPVFDPPDVIVLLSDGVSNRGVSLLEAANRAKAMNVKVYTVGVGTVGGGSPSRGPGFRSGLDETSLRHIAETTRGEYFSAASAGDLSQIYQDLGSRVGWEEEKTEITFLVAAAALLASLAGGLLSLFHFQQFPW